MSPAKIEITATVIGDAKDIYEWRLDAQTQEYSFTKTEFSFSEHMRWLESEIASKKSLLFTGYTNGSRFGFIRFKLEPYNRLARISLNVAPQYRGRGMSKHFLGQAIRAFREESSFRLIADVMVENTFSQCFAFWSRYKRNRCQTCK